MRYLVGIALITAATGCARADTTDLAVEAKIPLGQVAGRIDHLAFDPTRSRLYVAELGNGSVGIVDLQERRVLRTVPGFAEPQGIAYEPTTDAIYVANAADGSVRVFSGADFTALGSSALGKDADNVRVDPAARRVFVGYGAGALAIIDPATRTRVAEVQLDGHPEGFQLDPGGTYVYVNVPAARQIVVVSREANRALAAWPTGRVLGNYPLAIDSNKSRVISVFRNPARVHAYDPRTGQMASESDVCADADDVFVDPGRERIYLICGEGFVEVLDSSGDALTPRGRLATRQGARTGLFVPELDRLIVAVRASAGEPAALWVLRPAAH